MGQLIIVDLFICIDFCIAGCNQKFWSDTDDKLGEVGQHPAQIGERLGGGKGELMKNLGLLVEGSVDCAVIPVLGSLQGKKAPAALEPAWLAWFERVCVSAGGAVTDEI